MGQKGVSLFDLFVDLKKRKTIREIQLLIRQLEDAVKKETHENKQNENQTTDGHIGETRHRATDFA